MALLKKSAYICTPNNLGQRALNDISKDTFERFLDDSVVTVNRRNKKTHMYVFGHDEQEIAIDYSFLIPPKDFENREIAPLQLITKNKELHHLIKVTWLNFFLRSIVQAFKMKFYRCYSIQYSSASFTSNGPNSACCSTSTFSYSRCS